MEYSKAIFLDRDGVINFDYGYVGSIDRFKIIPGVIEALKAFKKNGYIIIVITNQSGIGRKYYSINDFEIVNNYMNDIFLKNGIVISETFFCPHIPEDRCDCRKPKPGMIIEAIKKYTIDTNLSILFGDNEIDILAGKEAGIIKSYLINNKTDLNLVKNYKVFSSIKEYTDQHII